MTRWTKVRAVAEWEFLSTVKRVGYLITTFGMPVFLLLYGGVISAIGMFAHKKETEVRIYGVVDRAALLALEGDTEHAAQELPEEIRIALERMQRQSPMTPDLAWWGNFVFRPYPDLDAAKQALGDAAIDAVYVLPADFVVSGRVEVYAGEGLDFQGGDSRRALSDLVVDRLLQGKVAGDVAERVRKPFAERETFTVLSDGTVEPRSLAAQIAKLVVPLVFTFLLFISLMMSAGYLLQGTAVEKENKLAEVILSAANPEEIMAGKLLGLGAAGLLQMCVWFGMLLVAGAGAAGTLQLSGVEVPWGGMLTGLFFFIAGYLFLGSLMLGTGSLGNNARESQQFSMIWTLLMVVPMVFLQVLLLEPNGTLGQILTWIPFTAPVTVVLRTTLEPEGIAWWEVVGSFAVLVIGTWFAVRLGARLFRVGLLLSGARPKLRDILRQARLST